MQDIFPFSGQGIALPYSDATKGGCACCALLSIIPSCSLQPLFFTFCSSEPYLVSKSNNQFQSFHAFPYHR
jgi:hypothetical protein